MFTRPPFLLIAALLAGLGVSSLIAVTPIGDDFWWSRLAPVAYSVHLLETTRGFGLPRADSLGCRVPFGPADAWRTLAQHPNADSLFREVFAKARAPGRLYALIGLYRRGPPYFNALVDAARLDSASVMVWDWKKWRGATVPLGKLAQPDSIKIWADLFAQGGQGPECAA
jgi:aryl carrier-like protein